MNTRILSVITAAITLLAGFAPAQAADTAFSIPAIQAMGLEKKPGLCKLHFTLANTFSSRYWGSIVGGIFYSGGAVNFTDFTATLDDPWGSTYILIGAIHPLDTTRWDYKGGTEYYAGIGRTFDLWKGGKDNLPLVKLNAFFMYDALNELPEFDNDVIQEFLRIDFPRIPFAQPYFEGYHWEKSGKNSPPVGFFARAGIHRKQPIGFSLFGSPMALDVDLSAGYSGEVFGASPGLAYYRAVLSTDVKLTKNFKVVPACIMQLPGHGQEAERSFVDHSRAFWTLSLVLDF